MPTTDVEAPTDTGGGRSWSVDDIDAEFEPVRKTVRLCIKQSLVAELEQLEAELEQAHQRDRAAERQGAAMDRKQEARPIAEQIEKLREQAGQFEVPFTFQALGNQAWNDLVTEHPATKEQRQKAERDGLQALFNEQTFQPAAVAACLVEPAGVTADKAAEWMQRWNLTQWRRLWDACVEVNVSAGDLGKESAIVSRVLRATETK